MTNPANNPNNPRFEGIQILRGIAAMLVVIHHFTWVVTGVEGSHSWIASSGLGELGKAGVDIFFVISGFIMTVTAAKMAGPDDAMLFMKRRVLRIYPIYWVYTTLLVGMWLVGAALKSHHYTADYIAASYLLIPASNGSEYHPFLDQGWTLSFEMYFYLLFAMIILFGGKAMRMAQVAGLFAVGYVLAKFLPLPGGLAYLFSDTIVVEFLFGMAAAKVTLAVIAARKNQAASGLMPLMVAGIGAILFLSNVFLHETSIFATLEPYRFIYFGMPAFLIVTGVALMQVSGRNLFVFIGDASYTIYLAHSFFTMSMGVVAKKKPDLIAAHGDLVIVLGMLGTVLITCGLYKLIEKPIINWAAALLRKKPIGQIKSA